MKTGQSSYVIPNQSNNESIVMLIRRASNRSRDFGMPIDLRLFVERAAMVATHIHQSNNEPDKYHWLGMVFFCALSDRSSPQEGSSPDMLTSNAFGKLRTTCAIRTGSRR